MPIVPLHGHDALRSRLLQALGLGTLPQSLLLHGDPGVGKQRLALWLANALVCENPAPPCGTCRQCRMAGELTHPDVSWVFPRPRLRDSDASPDEVKADLIDATLARAKAKGLYPPPSGSEGIFVPTIRMLVRAAGITPALARRKVIIVGDAERMVSQEGSDQAANAFLKLLEEPPANTYLILTSSTPGALLPTIRSRVVAVRVAPLPLSRVLEWLAEEDVEAALGDLSLPAGREERAALAAGAPGRLFGSGESAAVFDVARRFLRVAESGDGEGAAHLALSQGSAGARGRFTDVLEAIESQLRSRMRDAITRGDERRAKGAARAVESLEDAKQLAQGNVNPQLIASSVLVGLSEALTGP
jgi:DNA polymerase-3 subunit delta'